MNISKLNPVGYYSTTQNGNTYKKSNLGKTSVLGAYVAMQAADEIFKFSKNTPFESGKTLSELEKTIGKTIPAKVKPLILAASYAIDVLVAVGVGSMIDKHINKKRAAKADMQA